jgi:hypothetical protein
MNFNLNLNNGRDLAYIKGGKNNNEIVYLGDKEDQGNKKINVDDMALLVENLYKNMGGRVNFKQLEELQNSIMDKKKPTNRTLGRYYDQAMKILDKTKGKEIILSDGGKMKPMFDTTKERSVFMVTGMSGSGKSTYTGELINSYQKMYPKNEVFVFSNKNEDPALDKYDIKRLPIDEDLLDEPINLDELANSLVVFDDIEGNPDKKINTEMDRLRDLILQQGRSYKISFVYISHLANNYKQTRTILNECTSITIFPAMTTKYALKYLLEKYFGFDKNDLNKIINLPSRWVTIYKAPITVLYEGGCYIL